MTGEWFKIKTPLDKMKEQQGWDDFQMRSFWAFWVGRPLHYLREKFNLTDAEGISYIIDSLKWTNLFTMCCGKGGTGQLCLLDTVGLCLQ
jgi:hypothetical protein